MVGFLTKVLPVELFIEQLNLYIFGEGIYLSIVSIIATIVAEVIYPKTVYENIIGIFLVLLRSLAISL